MASQPILPLPAKFLIWAHAALAAFVVYLAFRGGVAIEIFAFLPVLVLCVVASLLKVALPGIQGSVSMSFVFLIWGTARAGLGETIVMGLAATVAQSYGRTRRRPGIIQAVFNCSVITVSIGASAFAFHSPAVGAVIPGELARLMLAASAYFVTNTLPVAAVIALTEPVSLWNVWRQSYAWSFPHHLLGACLVRAVEFFRSFAGFEAGLMILPVVYLVYRTYVMHVRGLQDAVARAEQERRHAEETTNLHLRTIRALALAIEAKDKTTGEHLHRVQTYAVELGKEFGLSPSEMEALTAAAILHDVGKLAVPEWIISKPGKLTPEEFAKMKIHTVVGAEIVQSVNFPFDVTPLVRAHHEKWDGTGYPDGLKGEEIPMGARILTAVDCLDALASDRQYRKALPFDKAMGIVEAESGKSFDPRVVEVLKRRCYELEQLAKSTLDQNMIKLSIDTTVERGLAPDAGYAIGSSAADKVWKVPPEEAARERMLLDAIHARVGAFPSFADDLLAIKQPLGELVPFDCMALFQRKGEKLECTFADGESASLLLGMQVESGVGVSGWVEANRTALLNGNAVTEFGVMGTPRPGFSLASALSIPLESEFGPTGVLTIYSRQRDAFKTAHLRILLAISARLSYQMRMDTAGIVRTSTQAGSALASELNSLSEALDGSGVSNHLKMNAMP